jgi:hypothetical protein
MKLELCIIAKRKPVPDKLKIFVTVKMLLLMLWIVTPCGLVGGYDLSETLAVVTFLTILYN